MANPGRAVGKVGEPVGPEGKPQGNGMGGTATAAKDGDVIAVVETDNEIRDELLGTAQNLAVAGENENNVLLGGSGKNRRHVF